jgi:hypothetical protein
MQPSFLVTKKRRRTSAKHTSSAKPAAVRYQHPLVATLRQYARIFGDFEGPLLKAAHDVNVLASIDDAKMYKRFEDAVTKGCHAPYDIIEESRLHPDDVKRIYEQLLIEGRYVERPIGLKTEMASGRRQKGIFLKSSQAGNLARGIVLRSNRLSHYFNDYDTDDDDDKKKKDDAPIDKDKEPSEW